MYYITKSFLKMAVLLIIFPAIFAEIKKTTRKEGPRGMPQNKTMSCKEFNKDKRFNPYSILDDYWFVFYYYAPHVPMTNFQFRIPTKLDMDYLHFLMDHHIRSDFNWSSTMLMMEEKQNNVTCLLVERSDRGQFWLYIPTIGLGQGELTDRLDMQLKQTGDNKYLAIMACETRFIYIMSRLNDIPPKVRLQEEASRLGYVGRGGKSYLYQGHHWMPIPEADEKQHWRQHEREKRSKQ